MSAFFNFFISHYSETLYVFNLCTNRQIRFSRYKRRRHLRISFSVFFFPELLSSKRKRRTDRTQCGKCERFVQWLARVAVANMRMNETRRFTVWINDFVLLRKHQFHRTKRHFGRRGRRRRYRCALCATEMHVRFSSTLFRPHSIEWCYKPSDKL